MQPRPSSSRHSRRLWTFLAVAWMMAFVPELALAAKGDVNANNRLDAGDVLLASRIATRSLSATSTPPVTAAQIQAADVAPLVNGVPQGNGIVDVVDVLLLSRALSDEDVDGDGVPASIENRLPNNLSALARNSDGVGLDDGALDSDGDGVSNRNEVNQGSDPGNSADSLPRTLSNVTLAANRTFFPGRPYRISGVLTVPLGITMTVQPGAGFEFDADALLLVRGTLRAIGTPTGPIVLKSSSGTPTPGIWQGIRLDRSGSPLAPVELSLDRVEIRHAVRPVEIIGFSDVAARRVNVLRSQLLDFSDTGFFSAGNSWSGEVRDNLIQNQGRRGLGIGTALPDGSVISGNQLRGLDTGFLSVFTNPTFTGGVLEDNKTGVVIETGSSPRILNSRIVGNEVGIFRTFRAGSPVFNGNVISNTGVNYQSDTFGGGSGFIDAERNFWGTIDPLAIRASIVNDNVLPVDFVPFLSADPASGGQPVSETGLFVGILRPASGSSLITVPAGSSGLLLGPTVVPAGVTLDVASGVTIRAVAGQGFFVDGTLRLRGTTQAPIFITPVVPSTRWSGFVFGPTSVASLIDNTRMDRLEGDFRFAPKEGLIDVNGGELTLRNSELRDYRVPFGRVGAVLYRNGARGSVESTLLDPVASGSGAAILLDNSSPALTGNTIRNAGEAIKVVGTSTASIRNNSITQNRIGIVLEGLFDPVRSPKPVITGNTFLNNRQNSSAPLENVVLVNLTLSDYTSPIDVRGNFFGTTDRAAIQATLVSRATSQFFFEASVPIDFSNYLASAGGSAAPGSAGAFTTRLLVRGPAASAFTPGIGQTVRFDFQPLLAANVTVRIYNELDVPRATLLRQFVLPPGSVGPLQVTWNGRDSQDRLLPDGAYKFVVQADFVSGGSELYDPPVPSTLSGTNMGFVGFTGAFSPFENKTLKITVPVQTNFVNNSGPAIARATRVSVIVRTNAAPGLNDFFVTKADAQPCIDAGQCFIAIDDRLLFPGSTLLTLDGRDPSGRPLTTASRIYTTTPAPIQVNAVVLQRSAPTLGGVDGSPTLEITSDPFLIVQTLDQFATIAYCLDRTSIVTIKLLRPGFFDPNVAEGVFATFVQNQTQQATNCASGGTPNRQEFRGFALDDPDLLQVSEDGPYTFTIEARDPSNAARRTLYRGTLNVFVAGSR